MSSLLRPDGTVVGVVGDCGPLLSSAEYFAQAPTIVSTASSLWIPTLVLSPVITTNGHIHGSDADGYRRRCRSIEKRELGVVGSKGTVVPPGPSGHFFTVAWITAPPLVL